MNKLILIGLAVFAVYFMFFKGGVIVENMPPVIADSTSIREKDYEVGDLFDAKTRLKDLVEPSSYTIIEVYSDHCSTCRKLESYFPSLLRERDDFVIRRVRVFSGSISFTSQAEQQEWRTRQDAMREFYNYSVTPHIEIYDENGNIIAIDEGLDKSGFNTLKTWLNWKS